MKMKKKLENQHDELVQKENELYQALNKKYGDGEIDPSTGEFIPTPKEKNKFLKKNLILICV